MDISSVLAVMWGALMLLQDSCGGVPQGVGPPPSQLILVGSPPWEEANPPPTTTYEAPHTSPVYVRAEPVSLSEPQGSGWRPMHNPASWLSQPHPDNPPIGTGPSPFVFPGSRPPLAASPPFPQVPQQPTTHPNWRSSIPFTSGHTAQPSTPPLPQLSNEIPPPGTPGTTDENAVLHLAFPTRQAKEKPPETTQATAATDSTVPLTVNAAMSEEHTNVQQQGNATASSVSNDFSPLRVPSDLLDQKNAHSAGTSVDAATGGGSVTVTPNETSTPAPVDKDLPNIESPDYPLAGGAVAGIVLGSIALVALLAGLITYVVLRRPFLKLLNGHSKSSSENVAYIDDSVRTGYMNAHIELPKESSEEMTSLDNDSFLNSLEAVTIQNYWADTTKNTNV
ncbi:uncharacterized protein LOC144174526 [Haemaphysalis longicornis]